MVNGEHEGDRSKRASWTGFLQAFILSQEVELRPRPLGTFLARGELAYREVSDPRTQEVDQSSTSGHLPWKRRACLPRVPWPLGLW